MRSRFIWMGLWLDGDRDAEAMEVRAGDGAEVEGVVSASPCDGHQL